MSVKVAAQFTKETRGLNGLDAIAADLLAEPSEVRYLVAEYHTLRITEEIDDGRVKTPTIVLTRIEPIEDPAAEAKALALLQRAYMRRQAAGATNGEDPNLFQGTAAGDEPDDDADDEDRDAAPAAAFSARE